MSFVLDALKISERRRSRFARPVYVHPPRPFRARRRRGWIGALGSVLAIALVFVAWRLLVPAPPAAPQQTKAADPQGAQAGLNGAAENRPVAQGSSASEQAPNAAAEMRSAPPIGNELPGETLRPSAEQPPELASGGAPINATGDAQPAEPLLSAPPADWPSLELQMVFYSPEKGRSFAQINGGSYRVGDRLDDGPQVREISSDGIILAYRGERVRLGMQR